MFYEGKLNIARNYFWKNASINFICVYSHKRDVYSNKSTESVCTKYLLFKRWKREKKNYYKENGQKPQEYARNYYWNLSQDKRVERKE